MKLPVNVRTSAHNNITHLSGPRRESVEININLKFEIYLLMIILF